MSPDSANIYCRWVVNCTLGELIGFGGLPVVGGIVTLWLTDSLSPDSRSIVLYAVAVIGGLGEGAVLAWFQLRVLRAVFSGLNEPRWILATAAAAAFAWSLGYLAPTLDDLFGISTAMQIAIWVPAGALILASIGIAQARVLRGVIERPGRWIFANAVGWLLGLVWTFLLPALVPEGASIAIWIAAFIAAGILMGVTVGGVTGFTLIRLAAE